MVLFVAANCPFTVALSLSKCAFRLCAILTNVLRQSRMLRIPGSGLTV